MTDFDDDHLDALLKRHLARQLDPVIGQAGPAFQQYLRRKPVRWQPWAWGIGLSAAAAVIALALLMREDPVAAPPLPAPGPIAVVSAKEPEMTRSVAWRDYDEGTMLLDAYTPVRRVRREIVETSQWYDPQAGRWIEMNIPREEVMLISMSKQ